MKYKSSVFSLIAGTMGFESVPAQPEREMGVLFSLEKDLSLKTKLSPVDISNGLAWSADQKMMYYIDSIPRKVFAFDFNVSTGEISKLLWV
jgi:gluconolactonase